MLKPRRGKGALVTGGSRSIGAAMAKRLPADGAAGALTSSASPHTADEGVRVIAAAEGKALAVRAEASAVDAMKAAVAKTVQSFGRLDMLVNNAGRLLVKPVNPLSLDDCERTVAVNVKGLWVATQEAVRQRDEGGRILKLGSIPSDHRELDCRSG